MTPEISEVICSVNSIYVNNSKLSPLSFHSPFTAQTKFFSRISPKLDLTLHPSFLLTKGFTHYDFTDIGDSRAPPLHVPGAVPALPLTHLTSVVPVIHTLQSPPHPSSAVPTASHELTHLACHISINVFPVTNKRDLPLINLKEHYSLNTISITNKTSVMYIFTKGQDFAHCFTCIILITSYSNLMR